MAVRTWLMSVLFGFALVGVGVEQAQADDFSTYYLSADSMNFKGLNVSGSFTVDDTSNVVSSVDFRDTFFGSHYTAIDYQELSSPGAVEYELSPVPDPYRLTLYFEDINPNTFGNTTQFTGNIDEFDFSGVLSTTPIVPEPASISLLSLSGLGLLRRQRRV